MEHFNNLTPSEAERLAILSEECGELIQAIGKVLRHGYDSSNPDDYEHKGNRADILKESADVSAAILLMRQEGDFDTPLYLERMQERSREVLRYCHHN